MQRISFQIANSLCNLIAGVSSSFRKKKMNTISLTIVILLGADFKVERNILCSVAFEREKGNAVRAREKSSDTRDEEILKLQLLMTISNSLLLKLFFRRRRFKHFWNHFESCSKDGKRWSNEMNNILFNKTKFAFHLHTEEDAELIYFFFRLSLALAALCSWYYRAKKTRGI